jgi:ABC-type polysaccharide/polyol phosphate export permease
MMVSAAGLFFRSVKCIVEVLLTLGIFFTPMFFEVLMFGNRGKWLLLNPVSPILEGLSVFMTRRQSPDLAWFAHSLIFSLVVLLGGHMLFKRLETAFAESI